MQQNQPRVIPPQVSISKGRVYASQGDVYALDATNGAIQMIYQFYSIFAPVVVEGKLYINIGVPHPTSTVNAIQTSDGVILWSCNTKGTFGGPPTVLSKTAYVSTTDGILYALQTRDGSLLWQYNYSGPCHFPSPTFANEAIYVSPRLNPPEKPFIAARSAKDGRLLWKTPITNFNNFPVVVLDGILYTGHTSGGAFANSTESCAAYRADDGSLLWQQSLPGRPCSSPTIAEEQVFIGVAKSTATHTVQRSIYKTKSSLCAFLAKDGSPLWQQTIEDTDDLSNLPYPVTDKNTIYVGTTHGSIYALNLDNGTLKWQYKTEGSSVSAPIVSDGTVFFGANDGCVYALNTKDGTLQWKTFVSTTMTVFLEGGIIPENTNNP